MFHQVEGLVVDEGITMADLKGVLDSFAKQMFGSETRTKFYLIISRSPNLRQRWTYPASNAEARAAECAREAAG